MGLRIAYFGQAQFGCDVLVRLLDAGHEIVGVYTPPAKPGGKPDPLAEEAERLGLPLFRHAAMRLKTGEPIPSQIAEHAALRADLNVLAFVTMILPQEIIDAPRLKSLCFHPSLLPKFRGGNALAWQIIAGEREAGVTVFRPDAGVDTGPIVLQKGPVPILPHHTAASLYFESLYALGVEAMVEAVARVADGTATYTPQDESEASFQGLVDDDVARPLEVAPIDLDIASQQNSGPAVRPAAVQRDVALRCLVAGVRNALGHSGLAQPVLYAGPARQG